MSELAEISSGALVALDRAKFTRLHAEVKALPAQIEPPVRNLFAKGLYAREMFAPAGSITIGALHLFDHFCVVLGDISVFTVGRGVERITGMELFVSRAGAQRALLAHADTWWTVIYPNPDDCRDVEQILDRLTIRKFDDPTVDVEKILGEMQ